MRPQVVKIDGSNVSPRPVGLRIRFADSLAMATAVAVKGGTQAGLSLLRCPVRGIPGYSFLLVWLTVLQLGDEGWADAPFGAKRGVFLFVPSKNYRSHTQIKKHRNKPRTHHDVSTITPVHGYTIVTSPTGVNTSLSMLKTLCLQLFFSGLQQDGISSGLVKRVLISSLFFWEGHVRLGKHELTFTRAHTHV